MPIVETKKYTRPNTGVEFFNLTDNPAVVQSRENTGYVFADVEKTATYSKRSTADAKMTVERTLGSDGLSQTVVLTYADIATYSHFDTCLSIDMDYAYKMYAESENFVPPTGQQYTQSGINQPFSCTTTYTYNSNTATNYPLFDFFINVLEASENLVSLTNNGSVITAVHNYADSEDFTQNHWLDYRFIEGLHAGGVTRTIAYATL